MNRQTRLQRLERKTPKGTEAPPVIIRSVGETGEPIRAVCGSNQLLPNAGETLAGFEARALEAFAQGCPVAVMLPAKDSQP